MYKRVLGLFLVIFLSSPFYAPCLDKPGAKLQGSIRFDKSVELTISRIGKAQKSRKTVFEAKFKNVSADTLRFYFEGCRICFWSISVNRGEFIPMDCSAHILKCPYRNLVELESGQTAFKTIVWEAYPECNTMKTYNEPIRSIKIRYLLKREGITEPAVYLQSNELRLD